MGFALSSIIFYVTLTQVLNERKEIKRSKNDFLFNTYLKKPYMSSHTIKWNAVVNTKDYVESVHCHVNVVDQKIFHLYLTIVKLNTTAVAVAFADTGSPGSLLVPRRANLSRIALLLLTAQYLFCVLKLSIKFVIVLFCWNV